MKKILALLLASLLVISLFAGCAKQTNDTMKKDEQPAANGETILKRPSAVKWRNTLSAAPSDIESPR